MAEKKQRVSKSQPSLPNVLPPQMGEIKKPAPKAEKTKVTQDRSTDLFIVDKSVELWKGMEWLH